MLEVWDRWFTKTVPIDGRQVSIKRMLDGIAPIRDETTGELREHMPWVPETWRGWLSRMGRACSLSPGPRMVQQCYAQDTKDLVHHALSGTGPAADRVKKVINLLERTSHHAHLSGLAEAMEKDGTSKRATVRTIRLNQKFKTKIISPLRVELLRAAGLKRVTRLGG